MPHKKKNALVKAVEQEYGGNWVGFVCDIIVTYVRYGQSNIINAGSTADYDLYAWIQRAIPDLQNSLEEVIS